ncbi:preprotein translocase subunit SecG [Candidatus Falkowbacteria bacterium]|nr:preprotein translocase subunit SecG [Candidatus Falkowbacteria bacterium]
MKVLSILQAVFAILTIITILLQGRGSGLGSAFGDSTAFVHTKRGAEKLVFVASIIFATTFLAVSLAIALL